MKEAVLTAFVAAPFVAIALLVWLGPKSLSRRLFDEAVEQRRATRSLMESEAERLADADRRLSESQAALTATQRNDSWGSGDA